MCRRLNSHLRNMLRGENRSLFMHLPEVQVNKGEYFVVMEIENKSVYEMEVGLKRKKLCDCLLKEVAVNINTTKKKYECVHREMLRVELAEPKFYVTIHFFYQSMINNNTVDSKSHNDDHVIFFLDGYPNTNVYFRKIHNNY